ncbi:hypothetical protein D3C78_623180 [compost metagenome]
MKKLPLALALLAVCSMAQAKETDASKLDGPLTPLGSERAANADGSIPAWDGGLKAGAAAVSATGDYADPFASEKPLYTVTKANVAQYQAVLTPGQQAMFARYPEYRMNVYPSHRTASMPKEYQEQSRANLTQVEMTPDGNGLQNYTFGVPFLQPTQAMEVMWNHLARYRGGSVRRTFSSATVQEKGDYTVVTQEALTPFRERIKDLAPDENILFFTRVSTISPSRYAGEVSLIQEPINQVTTPRAAWQYNPGQRRVRRAPTLGYDSSARYSFGQTVVDSADGFNGAPDRYDWKLIGKQELLVGYNAYRLASKSVKYADMLQPGHLNPDLGRYEKHRVWVVEATLKPGKRHVYAKRRFYIDEDSWQILVSDIYDSRGELWRQFEAHQIMYPELTLPWTALESTYDMISGCYNVSYMTNETPQKMEFGAYYNKADFTPAALKRVGK